MPLLRVIRGPDIGLTADLKHAPLTIGRGPDCGLRLTDPDVSLVHAIVEPVESGHRVRDLESASGTAVNGRAVFERTLAPGDTIALGSTALLYESGSITADTETVRSAESPGPEKTSFT